MISSNQGRSQDFLWGGVGQTENYGGQCNTYKIENYINIDVN